MKQRFLIYFTGAAMGVVLSMMLLKLKGPSSSIDLREETREQPRFALQKGGTVKLQFLPALTSILLPTYPSELVLGQEQANHRWKLLFTWQREKLVTPEIILSALNESGNYEARLLLFACAEPMKHENCRRLVVIVPFQVLDTGEKTKSLTINL